MESGIIVVVEMVQLEDPRSVKTCDSAGTHLSVDGSLEAVSEMIRIAAVNLGCEVAIVLISDKIVGVGWREVEVAGSGSRFVEFGPRASKQEVDYSDAQGSFSSGSRKSGYIAFRSEKKAKMMCMILCCGKWFHFATQESIHGW